MSKGQLARSCATWDLSCLEGQNEVKGTETTCLSPSSTMASPYADPGVDTTPTALPASPMAAQQISNADIVQDASDAAPPSYVVNEKAQIGAPRGGEGKEASSCRLILIFSRARVLARAGAGAIRLCTPRRSVSCWGVLRGDAESSPQALSPSCGYAKEVHGSHKRKNHWSFSYRVRRLNLR